MLESIAPEDFAVMCKLHQSFY